LSESNVAINHCYMYKNLQYCWYQLLLSNILYVKTYAVLQVSTVIINHFIFKKICCIKFIFDAINHCYMYKNLQYWKYLYLLSNIFISTKTALLLVSSLVINHCYMYKHLQCCWYLMLLTFIYIFKYICSIACN